MMLDKVNFKIGQKVTILNAGDLVPSFIKGSVQGYYYSKFAQYENALFIYIRRPRAKKIDRVVILPTDTIFIFDGYKWDSAHRKEVIKDNETITHSLLHRWTYEDLKDNKDLIYYHAYGQEFEGINNNFEYFVDITGDFMCDNNIRAKEAAESENYINYIKELIQNFNVESLMQNIKTEGYSVLENCLNKAISYNW